jgi:hypothetical protein
MKDADSRVDPEMASKRIYSRPRLVVYGDLSRITQAVSSKAAKNDHLGGSFKTV